MRARRVGRALRGEAEDDEPATREQAKAQEVSLPQRLAGAAAAAATMALVDQFTRWLAKQQDHRRRAQSGSAPGRAAPARAAAAAPLHAADSLSARGHRRTRAPQRQ